MNKSDYLPYIPVSLVLLFPFWHYEKLQSSCSGFGFLLTGRSFIQRDWGDGTDLCSFGARIDMPMMLVCLLVAGIAGVLIKKHLSQKDS